MVHYLRLPACAGQVWMELHMQHTVHCAHARASSRVAHRPCCQAASQLGRLSQHPIPYLAVSYFMKLCSVCGGKWHVLQSEPVPRTSTTVCPQLDSLYLVTQHVACLSGRRRTFLHELVIDDGCMLLKLYDSPRLCSSHLPCRKMSKKKITKRTKVKRRP